MSVTYTCKRMVNAFMGLDHEPVYLLSETTYESNVYPHTRHTHFCGIGKLPAIMERIFHDAACTEGGSLNSPDRGMTPERYIKSYLNALKKPFAYDGEAPLDLSDCWYAKDRLAALKADIEEAGQEVATVASSVDLIAKHRAPFTLPSAFSNDGLVSFLSRQAVSWPTIRSPQRICHLPTTRPSRKSRQMVRSGTFRLTPMETASRIHNGSTHSWKNL